MNTDMSIIDAPITKESTMRIGVPTEIKPDEYRVAMTPAGVRELTASDHQVVVQAGAGEGSGISNDEYAAEGAEIVADAAAVFEGAELIVKVKEPQAREVELLRVAPPCCSPISISPRRPS